MKEKFCYLAKFGKKYKGKIAWIIILSFISSVLLIGLAFLTRTIVNNINNEMDFEFEINFIIAISFLLLLAIINYITNRLSFVTSAKMSNEVQKNFYQRLLNKNYSQFRQYSSADLLYYSTTDVDIAVNGYITFLPNIVSTFSKLFLGCLVIMIINSYFALFCLGIGFVLGLITICYKKALRKSQKALHETRSDANQYMIESYKNIEVIKNVDNEGFFANKLGTKIDKNYKNRLKRNNLALQMGSLMFLTFNIAFYCLIIVGIIMLNEKTMLLGDMLALIQLFSFLKIPFRNATGIIPQYVNFETSVVRMNELIKLDEEAPATEVIDFEKIVFKNISFAYSTKDDKSEDYVINNLSFDIKPKEKIAIIGHSGSGKTTLTKLLLGFLLPNCGEIYFENNGEKHFGLPTKTIAYVNQSNLIFAGTIKENILAGRDIDKSKFNQVCEIACVNDFMSELKEKENTVLGESGNGLSCGQSVRIAIARALVSDPKLLVLDEASSALDIATEEKLLNNLFKKEVAMIFVTHKTTMIEKYDKIIDLNKN